MADIKEIQAIVGALIKSLDKTSSPNDIIEAFEEELDAYDQLIQSYLQN